ncbi:MAG: metal-dependent hydrolase [Halobacteriaceae archaeon]
MYVGHELLGFALVAVAAHAAGWSRERTLAAGLLGFAFGFLPDVDLAYTGFAVARAMVRTGSVDVFPTTEYVWTRSWVVHRDATHSLVVGALGVALVTAFAVGYRRWRAGRRDPSTALAGAVAALGALALVGLAAPASSGLVFATLGLYAALGVAFAAAGVRRGLPAAGVAGAAAAGLFTHPFGDVFMGRPPAFGYPLTRSPPVETVRLFADPTLNFLALFGIEVALAWACVLAVALVDGSSVREWVRPRAALGAAYGAAVLVVPPPTLDLAYQFSGGALAAGLAVGGVPALRRRSRSALWRGAVTALAALSTGLVGYLLAYLLR